MARRIPVSFIATCALVILGLGALVASLQRSFIQNIMVELRKSGFLLATREKSGSLAAVELPRNHGRHVAMDMVPRDPRLEERFRELSGPGRRQDDPELVQFIRDEIIEERRPFVPKMSHNLYRTPQAQEVDRIFKKVCHLPH